MKAAKRRELTLELMDALDRQADTLKTEPEEGQEGVMIETIYAHIMDIHKIRVEIGGL